MTSEELMLYQRRVSEAERLQREIYEIIRALRKLNLSERCPVLIVAGDPEDRPQAKVPVSAAFRERVIALLTDQLADKEKAFAELTIDIPPEKKEAAP